MKTYYFLILATISVVFSSCDLTGSTNNTPQILLLSKPTANVKDTLNLYPTDQSGIYKLDTICVGDTVNFRVLLNGFSNNLTAYYLVLSDTLSSKLVLPDKISMDSIFASTSDYKKGKFIFQNKILNLYFPFRYVALKETTEAKITFALSSDASFEGSAYGSNVFSFGLKTPIKKAKTPAIVN